MLITKFNKIKLRRCNKYAHPYFLVTPSIIPLLTSLSTLFFVTEIVNYFYSLSNSFFLILSFIGLTCILFEWFYNIIWESDYHTKLVQYNNKVAFLLFILTEVMFFFSLFWAFFHGSLSPSIEFDNVWPPRGISVINAFGPPLWGTWVLWLSSVYALHIKEMVLINFFKNSHRVIRAFFSLIVLAIFFTFCQLCEFYLATFSFREGFYGSIFYLLTGFHGLHVIIGTIFLFICGLRFIISSRMHWFIELHNWNVYHYQDYISYPKKHPALNKNYTILETILFVLYVSFFSLDSRKYFCLLKNKTNRNINSIYYPSRLKTVSQDIFGTWQAGHYSGLECGVWYWQFVDIIWIFVWIIIYIWGNNSYPFNLHVTFSTL